MDWTASDVVPAARSERLVVEYLDDEALIYDPGNNQAHHLKPTAAAVFELCDGRTTVGAVAAKAAERLGEPVSVETVRDALGQLAERELLSGAGAGLSRREMVRRAAVVGAGAAVAGAMINSIVAPTPAQADSLVCGPGGTVCDDNFDCPGGQLCSGGVPSCCEEEDGIDSAPGSSDAAPPVVQSGDGIPFHSER